MLTITTTTSLALFLVETNDSLQANRKVLHPYDLFSVHDNALFVLAFKPIWYDCILSFEFYALDAFSKHKDRYATTNIDLPIRYLISLDQRKP